MDSPFARPGTMLAIREEGAGPPVLFLHALGASSRYFAGRLLHEGLITPAPGNEA